MKYKAKEYKNGNVGEVKEQLERDTAGEWQGKSLKGRVSFEKQEESDKSHQEKAGNVLISSLTNHHFRKTIVGH